MRAQNTLMSKSQVSPRAGPVQRQLGTEETDLPGGPVSPPVRPSRLTPAPSRRRSRRQRSYEKEPPVSVERPLGSETSKTLKPFFRSVHSACPRTLVSRRCRRRSLRDWCLHPYPPRSGALFAGSPEHRKGRYEVRVVPTDLHNRSDTITGTVSLNPLSTVVPRVPPQGHPVGRTPRRHWVLT